MFGLQLLARLYFGEPVGGAPGTLPLHCFTYIFHCVYCFCVDALILDSSPVDGKHCFHLAMFCVRPLLTKDI